MDPDLTAEEQPDTDLYMERNHLCKFDKVRYREHIFEIILNLVQWFRRKSLLKIFLI